MAFEYSPRTLDSNFEPLAIEFTSDGLPLASLGVVVTVTVLNHDTRRVIVRDGLATLVESPGASATRWQYFLTAAQLASIVGNSVCDVQWRVKIGTFVWTQPDVSTLAVRKPL